jgi:eukaryotic-like serine/threonine-protein kinase
VLSGRPAPLDRLGRYELVARIGAGGMGVVYRAFDPELRRHVAVKRAVFDEANEARARARFLREAQAMAQLSHPHVVPVYDVGGAGEDVFLAMELVEGGTLTAWLRAPRTAQEILAVFVQAARGLAAAHAHGVVHRDFKPHNVLVSRDGRARVTDFGLARLAGEPEADGAAGTPAYMAPEQLRGEAGDAQSDQFAFAVALYEALAGRRPFLPDLASPVAGAGVSGPTRLSSPTIPELAPRARVAASPAPLRHVRRAVRRALLRALDADPARRT